MNKLTKMSNMLRDRFDKIDSEEMAKNLILEYLPQIKTLSEQFSDEKESTSNNQLNEIDWIDEISEYMKETIQLFLLNHVKGNLSHIHLAISKQNQPIIEITIDEKNYIVDFEEFKNGTDEKNRDEHRECYYRYESIWSEYIGFSKSINIITTGEELCNKLKSIFHNVTVDYTID
ncbi:MAG: hypothetical protein K0S41_1317 [Anaerocolumna sp.]|jgi:hypothetical protein|nr:hypothetical protein [Anaerocolumna sp.]